MRGTICGVLCFVGFLGFALVGCGGGAPSANKGDGVGGATAEISSEGIKTRELSELPAVDAPLPIADQGRVQFSLPEGWKTLARNPKFLVACVPEEGSAATLPRIAISVSDPPADVTTKTTADNVAELADILQAQLKKDDKIAIESCKPLILGSNPWVRHVRKSRYKDEPVAVQYLQTVQSGRLYTVDLTVNAKDNPKSSAKPIVYDKSLLAHRDFAYAVAANMKFPKEGGGTAEPPPPTTEEEPAVKKVAEPADKPAEPAKSE